MKTSVIVTLTLFFMLSALSAIIAPRVLADSPLLIKYQGRLTDDTGQPVSDGSYSLIFAIYDDSVGGNQLWTETHNSVAVTDGLFAVELGSSEEMTIKPLRFEMARSSQMNLPKRYLEIQIAGGTPFTPRTRLDFAPYAGIARAVDGDFLSNPGGITVSDTIDGTTTISVQADRDSGSVISLGDPVEGVDVIISSGASGGHLAISDIGSSGEDGVDLEMGESGGGIYFWDKPSGLPPDTTLRVIYNAHCDTCNALMFANNNGDTAILAMNKAELVEAIANSTARFEARGGALTISNVGSSGEDGVVIDVNPSSASSLRLGSIGLSGQDGITLGVDPAALNSSIQVSDPAGGGGGGRVAVLANDSSSQLYVSNIGSSGSDGIQMDFNSTATTLRVRSAGGPSGSVWLSSSPAIGAQVGINTESPSQALHVNGNICYTGTIGACSDGRYKKGINTISGAIEKIMKLRGVNYSWRKNDFPDLKFDDNSHIGFIAQEIRELLPEVVLEDANGYLSIDYGRLTPLLVEAIKEQQRTINKLRADSRKAADMEEKLKELSDLVNFLLAEIKSIQDANVSQTGK